MPDEQEPGTPEGTGGQEPVAPKPDDNADEALGDAGKRALERERERRREAEAKLEEATARLQAAADAEKSELEKLNDNLTDARSKAESASSQLLRLEVALEAAPEGMSIAKVRSLAKRLTGDTREDLLADAEELFSEFGSGRPPEGGPKPKPKGGNNPTDDDDVLDADAIAKSILASPW